MSEQQEEQKPAKRRPRPFHFLSRLLLLDVLANKRTAPVLIYAGVMVGFGAVLYRWLEGWSWLDSVYFVVITLTTIGYGDLHPTTPVTKLITIFYGINGIIILLMFFDIVRKVRGWDMPEGDGKGQKHDRKVD